MSVFETFSALYEDFDMCKSAFKRSHEAAKDICAAVRYRLEAEDAQVDERISELERRQNEPGCNATVRRVIAMELEQLRNRTAPAPTPEEIEAFQQEITAAETAAQDACQLRTKIRQAVNDLDAKVQQMRSETLGNQNVDLYERWLEGVRRDFARLGEG